MATPELLSTREAAEYLGVRVHSLEVWRCNGRYFIPYVKIGRLVKYKRLDLDAWIASRTISGESAS